MNGFASWFAMLAGIALPTLAFGDVKLPPILSSHMVLQREMAVPIWGTAAPGEEITVTFRDQSKTIAAGKDGKWSVKLDALKAGGPDKLTVKGTNTIVLDDVLVGEVWVGSGQSNMQGNVGGYAKADPVLTKYLEASPYPTIRLARVTGGWKEATQPNVNSGSALLFSFGVRLQQELKVPVGLMLGAVGGTPSGPWLSEEAYNADEACKEAIAKFSKTFDFDAQMKKYEAVVAKWEKDAETAKKDNKPIPKKPAPPQKPGTPTAKIGNLYEAHIRGFIPFGIRGVLWDQGESGTAIAGLDQYTLMGALIRGWRKEWNQGDFAFLYVQKPSGGGCAWDPESATTKQANKFAPLPKDPPATAAGLYRETHIRIRYYPNTAMVTATDLGSGIHPTNKSGYGDRACLVAMGMVYGGKAEYYGPIYAGHKLEGQSLRVTFKHASSGLAFKHGTKLQGFAIAGADKVFHWAEATIDGNAVLLSSPSVKEPVAVRYAWGNDHPWANLFNKDGLPAQTFRSDDW